MNTSVPDPAPGGNDYSDFEEIDEVERKVMQMEIERQALKREEDKASKQRLAQLEPAEVGARPHARLSPPGHHS